MRERIARPQHEDDAVQPDVGFLHPHPAERKNIAQYHHGEGGQHHGERQPRDTASNHIVQLINCSYETGECVQRVPLLPELKQDNLTSEHRRFRSTKRSSPHPLRLAGLSRKADQGRDPPQSDGRVRGSLRQANSNMRKRKIGTFKSARLTKIVGTRKSFWRQPAGLCAFADPGEKIGLGPGAVAAFPGKPVFERKCFGIRQSAVLVTL